MAPTPRAERSCSTESAEPIVSTVTWPSVAAATCTPSSTAHWSWLLIVKPTKRASADCASSVSSTSPEKSGTRFTQTSTSVIGSPAFHRWLRSERQRASRNHVDHRIRSLLGSNSDVASTEPTVTG